MRFFAPAVIAPPILAVCPDRSFAWEQDRVFFDPEFATAMFGLSGSARESEEDCRRLDVVYPNFPASGISGSLEIDQMPWSPMQVPQLSKLILDSGKLAKLDALLQQLKGEGHRVLIYFQMTRMIDLMEEYLAFRQFKYLRLDGSSYVVKHSSMFFSADNLLANSTISERRDMVMDWQTRSDLFIFLLSTRAGGLGINLTAADTVIFYDSDW